MNVFERADDRCKRLLMDCESCAEASHNSERSGNITRALADCQQAIGEHILLTFVSRRCLTALA